MINRRRRDRTTERDLAALADGSLAEKRRADVECGVAASPELQADLREQRYAIAAVRAADTEAAPAALRARVNLRRAPARPARRIGALAVAGAAAIAAATAVILALSSNSATPNVGDATAVATRPPLAHVAPAARGAATLASPREASLRFPSWAHQFGWKATGARRDRVGGHPATTVFYRRAGHDVAYTIVGGRPLRLGSPARVSVRNGITLRSLTVHGRRVVTWLRHGHTCVLSGTSTEDAVLLRLASWRGAGAISQ